MAEKLCELKKKGGAGGTGEIDTTFSPTGVRSNIIGTDYEVGSCYIAFVTRSNGTVLIGTGATLIYSFHQGTGNILIFEVTSPTVTCNMDVVFIKAMKLTDISIIQ